METIISAALFGAVVPSFLAFNLLLSGMQKDDKIKLLQAEIAATDKILGVMRKKEF